MPYAASVSRHPVAPRAVGEVVGEALESVGQAPEAAVVVVTRPFAGAMEDIAKTVSTILRPKALVGVAAPSLSIGSEGTAEGAAVGLFAMGADGGPVPAPRAIALDPEGWPDAWAAQTQGVALDGATLIVLAERTTFPTRRLLRHLQASAPGLAVVGGLAAPAPGAPTMLVADGTIGPPGAVGLLLPAGAGAGILTSQGFRPVGRPMVVTAAAGPMVLAIGGAPALDHLLAVADDVAPADRRRMAAALHLGVLADEHVLHPHPGDFLVHRILGADHERRALALDADVAVGSTVQVQVRDDRTDEDDLRLQIADRRARAAIVFASAPRLASRGAAAPGSIVHEQIDGGPALAIALAATIGPLGRVHRSFEDAVSVVLLGCDQPDR